MRWDGIPCVILVQAEVDPYWGCEVCFDDLEGGCDKRDCFFMREVSRKM